MLRRLAAELIAEIRYLDRRIAAATSEITVAVAASNSSLTELCGIRDLTAGKILARVGDITRFPSAAAFASYAVTAPIEVSSGDVVRHRLSRAWDRQLNYCLHIMAITQIRHDTPGRTYYQRKRAAGKSHKEALRCLKRRLSDTAYRHLQREARTRTATGSGGHTGATTESSATGLTPTTDSSDKSQPGPAGPEPATHQPRST
jgi:transposase